MWIALHLGQLEIKNIELRTFSSLLYDTGQLIPNYVNLVPFLQSGWAPLSQDALFIVFLNECSIRVLKTNEAVIMTKTGIVSLYD